MSGTGREVVVVKRSVVPVSAPKRRPGRPEFQPTDEQREQVALMEAHGIPQESMAAILGISTDTLAKHFRKELDHGLAAISHKVAGSVYRAAIAGDVGAAKFWLGSRARWREREPNVTVNNLGDGNVVIDSKRSVLDEMRERREAAMAEAAQATAKAAESARAAS